MFNYISVWFKVWELSALLFFLRRFANIILLTFQGSVNLALSDLHFLHCSVFPEGFYYATSPKDFNYIHESHETNFVQSISKEGQTKISKSKLKIGFKSSIRAKVNAPERNFINFPCCFVWWRFQKA